MPVLVTNNEKQAQDVNEAIFNKQKEDAEAQGYKIINGEIEIQEGAQRTERWDFVKKAHDKNFWWVTDPIIRFPQAKRDEMLAGYTFTEQAEANADWHAPFVEDIA